MMRNIRIKSEHDVKRNICIILYGANILLIVIERRNAHDIQSAHGWSRFPKGTESSLIDGGGRGRAKSPFDHGGFGGSLEASPNGDGTAKRSLVHKGSMPMMHHKRACLKFCRAIFEA